MGHNKNGNEELVKKNNGLHYSYACSGFTAK
jgi:hypothetical protein